MMSTLRWWRLCLVCRVADALTEWYKAEIVRMVARKDIG